MPRPLFAAGTLVALAAGLSLTACGSSSNGPTSAPAVAPAGNNSSTFCTQAGAIVAGFRNLGSALITSPGATPSITAYKQLIASGANAIDSLDSQAPSDIASAFHTFRAAYDQANTQAQAATAFEQFAAVGTSFGTPAVKSASDQITAYLAGKCGITAAPVSTP